VGRLTARFLVVGHPRSGTRYMAELLQAFGYDVKHEAVGNDGTSCWCWSTHDPTPPWAPGPRREIFGTVIHVLRHPLHAIASIALTDGYECKNKQHRRFVETTLAAPSGWASAGLRGCASIHYRQKYTVQFPEWDHLDNAAMSYLQWTNMVQAQGPQLTVRVEHAPAVLAEYLGRKMPAKLPPTDSNTRKHRQISLNDLRLEVRAAVLRFCNRWGYALEGSSDA
jgi:hypothetical protein